MSKEKEMYMNLKVKLLRPGAKPPRREHPTDAGADVFYCCDPDESGYCIGDENEYWIGPQNSCVIPTGIKIEVPEGYMLEVKNKSGIASKKRLVVGACVVDSGYDGEIFINLHNLGQHTQRIAPGEKLAQVVLIPVETCGFITPDGPINFNSTRGEGSFGSTGDR
jgi:dUTP pyrophosphatase